MKYKVGDEVRIKSLDSYNENKDNYGAIYAGNGFCFWEYMVRHCGEIMKIAIVKVDPEDSNKGYYFMETSEEKWTDEMIEGLVERNGKIYPYKIGDRVILKGNNRCATITDLKYNCWGNLSYYIKIDNDKDISIDYPTDLLLPYNNKVEWLVEDETKSEPKFKVGDKVKWYNYICNITSIDTDENTYTYLIKHDDYREDKTFAKWVPENELTFEDDVETEPELKFKVGDRVFNLATKKSVNIIEWDEETGLYIVRYDDGVLGRSLESELKRLEHITLDDVKDETNPKDMGEVSDGYHTFNELYEYRMLYNAALFNEFAKQGLYDVHKSRKHSDGEYPFGDSNWFIVMAELPTGQISNHYEMKDWDKFQIPEKEVANKWDEHSPRDVADRLRRFLTPKPKYPQTYEECCKVMGVNHTNDLDICEHCDYKTEITYYEDSLLEKIEALYRLIICRDAYWKIAGEEMGLGKPWKPYFTNFEEDRYGLYTCANKIVLDSYGGGDVNVILTFPTEEMRDAFYENFKKDIEKCKELL